MADAIYAENEIAVWKTNSLGIPLVFKGPNSEQVYDRRAGKVGAMLESAVDNDIYRGTLPEFQDEFAKYLAEKFPAQPRLINEKATADAKARAKDPTKAKDVYETVKTYWNRIKAGLDKDALAAIKVDAQAIADGIYVDPSPSARAAGLSKEYRAKAEQLLTLPTEQLEAKVTKFLDAVEGFDLQRDEDNKPTVESLGRLVKTYLDAMMEEV